MPVQPLPDHPGANEPYYCTIEQVRDALGVDRVALSDAAALDLILTAEDLIDQELGARYIDHDSGRRVAERYVRPWQWSKLTRATIKLATLVYAKPDLALGLAWTRVKGPDFEFEGPLGKTTGAQVTALLDQSGLRRLTVSTRRGFSRWRLGYPSNADPVYDDE